jgi:hypothetical protein
VLGVQAQTVDIENESAIGRCGRRGGLYWYPKRGLRRSKWTKETEKSHGYMLSIVVEGQSRKEM